ncbi:MAG: peptide-methionine (S)-S-oxide reductase MsrA [Gemmatimonadetes bacterium]|nr:peptide-methionine (S)-S-oxide reductase MsrA [Gemmatimonadota bacterium]NIQ56109.1 peptide-methionine (S)-S-oxide reductase MsrA [Gemmatimonadota bacterium]NIU76293.1 peptide-methionine (S)-S-oxide reductase MsrA [Gammaproteobacteria bacterium]NIX45797.1 peptide-methionine (S)-S-oxide reductase MsrA [Gemmatimonadota bacterium]NIY10119.1 peptide-methionine (S)-S-oxide reductase MsrA [Gemmatimonadota bacterium]
MTETATLGGGCFWCLEAVFERLRGVASVTSGYAGGHVADPTYRQVCAGTTGHAEVVRVAFDPEVLGYRRLLDVFFGTHDPTTPDRQGADRGPQYRSIILYESDAQREVAESVIAELEAEGVFPDPIVTEVAPLEAFYRAEEYHQDYYRDNPGQGYCRVVIDPKIAKLRAGYADLLEEST